MDQIMTNEISNSNDTSANNDAQPVIKCDGVYKIFGDNTADMMAKSNGNIDVEAFREAGCIFGVNDASLEVHRGEMLIVMGLSGSGKSTLLRCISRLTDTTAGNIFIDGDDLLAMNSKELMELRRNKMGMVFQSFALLPHKTVLENIAFPLQVKGTSTDDSMKRAMDMVNLVDLTGRENYFPRQLSGGQQQRVGIARSLAVEPDIFLRLQEMLNKTILFVTHDFDEALRLADRIAIMKDGVIEQCDTPANIVLNPATEYVAKFTNEVPREKVLTCGNVMDEVGNDSELSDLKVSHNAVIETVAEAILNDPKPVAVIDDKNHTIGVLHRKSIIHILFGKKEETLSTSQAAGA